MTSDEALKYVLGKKPPKGRDEFEWRMMEMYKRGYIQGVNNTIESVQNLCRNGSKKMD